MFMSPGSDVCPPGWVTEYAGWLAAQHSQYKRTEFVCVDRYADNGGSNADMNGALFAPVASVCGALPCPPYKNRQDLICAVCSK